MMSLVLNNRAQIYTGFKLVRQFRFLLILSFIFGFCEDCLKLNLSLPSKTTICEKMIPAKTVYLSVLPAVNLGRKHNHANRLSRKTFVMYNSPGRKPEMADSLGGS